MRVKINVLFSIFVIGFVWFFLPNTVNACKLCSANDCVEFGILACASQEQCSSKADCCTADCGNAYLYCDSTTFTDPSCGLDCQGTKDCSCCTDGTFKCEGGTVYKCSGCAWKNNNTCPFGCAADGYNCAQPAYCQNATCSIASCNISDTVWGNNKVRCWSSYASFAVGDPYTSETCYENAACDDSINPNDPINTCHSAYETCGGNANCAGRFQTVNGVPVELVSHIDSCGNLNCALPCTPSGGGSCNPTNPDSPLLASPVSGVTYKGVKTVDFSWNAISNWGEECGVGSSRSYTVCVGTSQTNPCDVANGGSGTTVSDAVAPPSTANVTLPNFGIGTKTYYWLVKAYNAAGFWSVPSETRSFTVSNYAPSIVGVDNWEIKSTGTANVVMTTQDADGGSDIWRTFLSFNNCTADTMQAGYSNFERNNSNYFGAYVDRRSNYFAVAVDNTGATCVPGYQGPPTPWSAVVGPMNNNPGNLRVTNVSTSASGNYVQSTYTLQTTNFPVGSYSYYGMVVDNLGNWHAIGPTNYWQKIVSFDCPGGGCNPSCPGGNCSTPPNYPPQICVEGFSPTGVNSLGVKYLQDWSVWGSCNSSHKRTRTRSCTQDCSGAGYIDDCAGQLDPNDPALCPGGGCTVVGSVMTQTEDCFGSISGYIFDASDLAACPGDVNTNPAYGLSGSGGATFLVRGTEDPITAWTNVTVGPTVGNYNINLFTNGSGNTLTFDFTNLLTAGLIGDATPKLKCSSLNPVVPQPGQANNTYALNKIYNSFGFYRKYGGWWQVTGGNVHSDGTIKSVIPASLETINPALQKLVLPDGFARDGLISAGSGTPNLGTNQAAVISAKNFFTNQTYQGIRYDYTFFKNKLNGITGTDWNGSGAFPAYVANSDGYMLIRYTGAGTMNFTGLTVGANQKYIILSPRAVNVNGYVYIPAANNGFLALISDGTITFSNSLGRDTSADTTKTFDGWYIGESINFGTTGNEATEKQFHGEGSFTGWSGVVLQRDRGSKNNTEPAEQFVYRQDFVTNMPSVLKYPYMYYSSYNP